VVTAIEVPLTITFAKGKAVLPASLSVITPDSVPFD
jgi:hypothetical protein